MSRMRRLLDVRKAEFEGLPIAERERLRRAFAAGNPVADSGIDEKGFLKAITELGFEGHTRAEKEEIRKMGREAAVCGAINFFEFVFVLVPQVEQKLQEMRSPKLHAQYMALDLDENGNINIEVCMAAIQQKALRWPGSRVDQETVEAFWKDFATDFQELFKKCRYVDGKVDYNGFRELVGHLEARRAEFRHNAEKRASTLEELHPQMEKAHFGELSYLRGIFSSYSGGEQCLLEPPKLTMALMDCGVLPGNGEGLDRGMEMLEDFFETHSAVMFPFKTFLTLIQKLRAQQSVMLKAILRIALQVFDNEPDDELPCPVLAGDVPKLIVETNLCRDCIPAAEQRDRLALLVDMCEQQGVDQLNLKNLMELVAKVLERARSAARAREAVIAQELELSQEQVLELRMHFAGLTRTGVMGIPEIQSLLKGFIPPIPSTVKDVEVLISDVLSFLPKQSEPHRSNNNTLNNLDTVHKAADTSERSQIESSESMSEFGDASNTPFSFSFTKRQSTASPTQTGLLFDGYLWLVGHILKNPT